MAQLPAEYKRAFLRAAWEAAPEGASTLKEYLLAALTGRISETSSGRQITGTSQSGASVSFFIPQGSGFTPQAMAELCEELLTLYEASTSADEAVIYAEIREQLYGATEFRPDFSTYGINAATS